MNIYVRYFDNEYMSDNLDDLFAFLESIPDISLNDQMIDEVRAYVAGSDNYPKRVKVRTRNYFILIKTTADSLEEFKAYKSQENAALRDSRNLQRDQRLGELQTQREGWYFGSLNFKRVVMSEEGKSRYVDAAFSAYVKARSGQHCYNRIVEYLQSRPDIDARSQFPSQKGQNFKFEYMGEQLSETQP